MITAALLRAAIPSVGDRAEEYAPHLEAARQRYIGDNWHHVAMWLAQIAHESGALRYVVELASGDAYEGRRDLGNTEPGDGRRFRGRGLLQVTGRDNYRRCGEDLGLPLLDRPDLLETPQNAAMSAGWVWVSHGLAELCNATDPVLTVTRRLNGGINGLDDRRQRYETAMTAMKFHLTQPQFTQAAGTPPQGSPEPPPTPAAVPPAPLPERPSMPLPVAAIAALGVELLKLLPFAKKPENAAAVEKVGPQLVALAKEVAGPSAVNDQQAVEIVQRNPAAQQQFVAKAVERWSDIAPALEFEAAQRREAREFTERMTGTGPTWRQVGSGALIGALSLFIVVGGGLLFWDMMYNPNLDPGQKGLILGALIAAFTTAVGFWFGSSASGRQSGQTVSDIAKGRQ